jgi:hypothetical protein
MLSLKPARSMLAKFQTPQPELEHCLSTKPPHINSATQNMQQIFLVWQS